MKVKIFANLREITKVKQLEGIKADDVRGLLSKLCDKFGRAFEKKVFPDGKLSEEIIILINGIHITHLKGLDTSLNDDDEISIFPMVYGG
ncbi:MAG: sulfur-carrier protein [Thermosediminibacterales bacterium]|nr:sulfur-carrier protein [Thermosediminibacterales bacterium]